MKLIETNDSIYKESSLSDITKLYTDLNWRPEIGIKEGIKMIIDYERERLK